MVMTLSDIQSRFNNVDLEFKYSCGEYEGNNYGILVVDKFVVHTKFRKHGIGTEVMSLICRFANSTNCAIMLSPSTCYGATSIDRLKRFYRRFGFVSNIRKNKVYTFPNYGMYRIPNIGQCK